MRVRSAAVAMALFGAVGCGSPASEATAQPDPPIFDPHQRAVRIETTGCGYAAGRTGSGVAMGDGVVLTVAHLVVRADTVLASVNDGAATEAAITAVDLNRDLAVLRLPPDGLPSVEMTSVAKGDRGLIVGGAVSGTVPFEVKGVMGVTIEEVFGTERHRRLGYEVLAATARGDSGAGAYDERNRLIGIVFATSPDGESSWITSSIEIESFLAHHRADTAPMRCVAESSRLDLP
jgi:S1-C subfamily serine protease